MFADANIKKAKQRINTQETPESMDHFETKPTPRISIKMELRNYDTILSQQQQQQHLNINQACKNDSFEVCLNIFLSKGRPLTTRVQACAAAL